MRFGFTEEAFEGHVGWWGGHRGCDMVRLPPSRIELLTSDSTGSILLSPVKLHF